VISATFTLDFCFLPSDKKIHPQIKAEREREREREFRVTRGCVTLFALAIYIKKSILKAKEEV
jgi:hypothetical protein